jgi:carbohydrate kinase (thermoresistant glucokinase family)
MGVSGCGKTSVGQGLSEALDWPFFDGDEFPPQGNIDKMARGIPLNDEDRRPWLEMLHNLIVEHVSNNRPLIVACSALKARYRQILKGDLNDVLFVHLMGSFDLIHSRMKARSGHYMQADMLRSQFADLEAPPNALSISVEKSVEQIVAEIRDYISSPG